MKNIFYTSIITVALCAACAHNESTQPAATSSADAAHDHGAHHAAEKAAEAQGPQAAHVDLKPAKKQKAKGMVHFTQAGNNLKVHAMLEGLKPGPHGFHIHEKGDCSAPDFSSAGGHFNPTGKPHADHSATERHVGDMGNIVADAKGKASLNIELMGVSLGGPNGVVGKAVIVHEKADDLKTQPTGNAGGRVACGVIEAMNH